MENLRNLVQASITESQAIQKEVIFIDFVFFYQLPVLPVIYFQSHDAWCSFRGDLTEACLFKAKYALGCKIRFIVPYKCSIVEDSAS